ncbi:hypothetical protein GCM10023176_46870 [Micromonospora coerulea]|uniref:Uncharacterized protein n=1 Tax=Micromonospora coerulea TaxID=47856 RepID=A0ABP8SXX2_9ACTN
MVTAVRFTGRLDELIWDTVRATRGLGLVSGVRIPHPDPPVCVRCPVPGVTAGILSPESWRGRGRYIHRATE